MDVVKLHPTTTTSRSRLHARATNVHRVSSRSGKADLDLRTPILPQASSYPRRGHRLLCGHHTHLRIYIPPQTEEDHRDGDTLERMLPGSGGAFRHLGVRQAVSGFSSRAATEVGVALSPAESMSFT